MWCKRNFANIYAKKLAKHFFSKKGLSQYGGFSNSQGLDYFEWLNKGFILPRKDYIANLSITNKNMASIVKTFQDESTEIEYFDLCIFMLKFGILAYFTEHSGSFEEPALFSDKLYSKHADL